MSTNTTAVPAHQLRRGNIARLPIATGVVRDVARHDERGLVSVTLEVVVWDHDVCELTAPAVDGARP